MPSPSIESITIEPASSTCPSASTSGWPRWFCTGLPCALGGALGGAALGRKERSGQCTLRITGLSTQTGNWKRGAVITGNYTCNYSLQITVPNYMTAITVRRSHRMNKGRSYVGPGNIQPPHDLYTVTSLPYLPSQLYTRTPSVCLL